MKFEVAIICLNNFLCIFCFDYIFFINTQIIVFYTNYAFLKTHYSSIYLAITCASLGSMMILGSA